MRRTTALACLLLSFSLAGCFGQDFPDDVERNAAPGVRPDLIHLTSGEVSTYLRIPCLLNLPVQTYAIWCTQADIQQRYLRCDPPQDLIEPSYTINRTPHEDDMNKPATTITCEYSAEWRFRGTSEFEDWRLHVRMEKDGVVEDSCVMPCTLGGAWIGNMTFDAPMTLQHEWRLDAWIESTHPELNPMPLSDGRIEYRFALTAAKFEAVPTL